MRIAVVTTSYPADAEDGAGSFVRAEALRLRAQGEVHVVCPAPAAADEGIVVHAVGGAAAFGWPGAAEKLRRRPTLALEAARFARRARRALARLAPDHVQAHWLVPGAFPIAIGRGSLEAVAHGGDLRALAALPRPLRAAIVRALLAETSTIRFVSGRGRDELIATLPADLGAAVALRSRVEPCALAPLGSRRERVTVRAELGLPEGDLAAVVGRLVPGKRVDLALGAIGAARLAAVVVGEGPAREALERIAPHPTRFVGKLPRSRTLDVIGASDLLVDASEAEGAPTVVREARALGVAVISCGAGDVPVWAAADPGITVVAPALLADAIRARIPPAPR